MIIGTVRPEEARVFDQFAGYHRFHTELPNREEYGSFEVFWHDGREWRGDASAWIETPDYAPGWYWRACSPGCLPDGEPSGPFASSRLALEDADEWGPKFDSADDDEAAP